MPIPRENHIEKIHDMTVQNAIQEIAGNASKEEASGEAGGDFLDFIKEPKSGKDEKSQRGKSEEKKVVVLTDTESRPRVVAVRQVKKTRDDGDGFKGGNG